MSDNDDNDSRNITVIPPDRQSEVDQADSYLPAILDIERQRIDSFNRRTDVASQAVAFNNEADKRQYDFQVKKLETEDSASQRRDRLVRHIVTWGGGIGTIILGLFLIMAFFGTDRQSLIAERILGIIGVGGGGYGLINAGINLVRRLIRSRP